MRPTGVRLQRYKPYRKASIEPNEPILGRARLGLPADDAHVGSRALANTIFPNSAGPTRLRHVAHRYPNHRIPRLVGSWCCWPFAEGDSLRGGSRRNEDE